MSPKPRTKPRTESEAGIHFVQTWLNCKRLFFFRYVLGWEPLTKGTALLMGAAYHDAKAVWYGTGSAAAAVKEYHRSLDSQVEAFESTDQYMWASKRGELLIKFWIETYGRQDMTNFRILGVEKELRATLPNGFQLTTRLDLLVVGGGYGQIVESKTGSFSRTLTEQEIRNGDQVTAQLLAVKQNYPKLNMIGVVPDIAYWHKESKDPRGIAIYRANVIQRTPEELEDFGRYTMDALVDMSQRVQAVASGKFKPKHVMGPNRSHCFSYHRVCPFLDLCHGGDGFKPKSPPPGFKRTPWKEGKQIMELYRPTKKRGSK